MLNTLSLRLEGGETLNTSVSVGLHAEKLNIVSHDNGCTQKMHFLCFRREIPCLDKFSDKKSKLSVHENLNWSV